MTFPQLKNKHSAEALFHPGDIVNYERWDSKNFPKKIVITYQRSALAYFKRKYAGKYESLKFSGTHKVLNYNGVGFIKMQGIGSPHASVILEELIALGVREFINIGTAGGLNGEGIVVCNRALRDEGTSHHYSAHGRWAYPDEKLSKLLKQTLDAHKVEYRVAPTWTIDAPYRETKAEVARYKKEGIASVEMEASALFTIAKLRKVKIASAFSISDILGEKWEPKSHTFDVTKGLNQLVDASMDCLGGKK